MANFKPGDVVQLKSGGPDMTVGAVNSGGAVSCHWFNQDVGMWTAQNTVFKPELLKVIAKYDSD